MFLFNWIIFRFDVNFRGRIANTQQKDLHVSKNRGTPKWMVYSGNPIKMDDLGGTIIFGNTYLLLTTGLHCSRAVLSTVVLTRQNRRAGFRYGTGFVVVLGV